MKRVLIFACLAVSAVAAEDANVKAFVPSLAPVKRVDAVYPEAARQQNAYGTVALFVTIDAGGNVVAAEPMQGPEILRPAAVDAIKQWTFRPVIREGHTVAAITTAMVSVTPPTTPDQPRPPAQINFTPDESMAYARRLAELTRQFPRTAQQVLADDEQQTASDTGLQRFYDLPRLAKAAYKAGDPTKAQGYANELLALAAQYPKDWNYGNAIHDGNMVLGLVAVQKSGPGAAVEYLLAAGRTPGSPQLGSFGPNMTLAKALLDEGQTAPVLAYFEECRAFWKMGRKKLDDWSAMVRGGGKPNFGANLAY